MRSTLKISLILLISLLLAACGGTSDQELPTQIVVPTSTETPTPEISPTPTLTPLPTVEFIIPDRIAREITDQAYLRVVNASPNLGVLDLYIESLAIATNLDYKTYTEQSGIVAGTYKIRIVATGTLLSTVPLYEQSITIEGQTSLILLITGTPEIPSLTVLQENSEPLQGNASRVSLLNAVIGANGMVMLANNAPLTPTVAFSALSDAIEFNTGINEFSFLNAGTQVVSGAFDLRARENYTMLVIGDLARTDTLEVIAFSNRAPGLTTITLVNASPSSGEVDFYIGKRLLLNSTAFAESSVPETVLSGAYDISIYPSGSDISIVEPLAATQFLANPDESIILILAGEANSLRFITYRNDSKPTYDNSARITFVNALESAPRVDMQSNFDLGVTLIYGQVSETFDLDIRATSFLWVRRVQDGQDVAVESFNEFIPTAGIHYVYVFSGRGFERPILIQQDVGTLGFSEEEEVLPTIAPSRPTRIRILNVWKDQPITVRLDDTIIAENLNYTDSTAWIIIPADLHTLSIDDVETNGTIESIETVFNIAIDYSILVYNGTTKFYILEENDTVTDNASGFVRVINLSPNEGSLFGMGYSQPNPNINQPGIADDYRLSLPVGVLQAARDTLPLAASLISRLPAGQHNIRVIDNDEAAIAYTFIEFTIEAGTLYDIIVQEELDGNQVDPVIIPFPPR